MRIGSLFSGYGGLDMACEQFFNATTAWHCEWDDAPSKILAHHWPDVPNFRDVTQIDWTTMPPVDILTGGYPCQPFSAAGQRKGTDDERHLWPYVREAIRVLRPRFTVLENVAGHRSLGFDRVLGDLAEDGMHVRWTSIRASDIGAPHHRERVFILVSRQSYADSEGFGWSDGQAEDFGSSDREVNAPRDNRHGSADTSSCGPLSVNDGSCGDATRPGWQWLPGRGVGVSLGADSREGLAIPEGIGLVRGRDAPEQANWAHPAVDRRSSGVQWGTYAPAIRRWERVTRCAPDPTEPNSNGNARLAAVFAEWMMGLRAGHVTAVPGLSRAEQLKAIGNGVVPQQAFAALGLLTAMRQMEARVTA